MTTSIWRVSAMQRPLNRTARCRPAFSIVELMIVVLVIALLAGILTPVLSKAYKTSLASADAALIAQISMGLEMYNQAFYVYPSSAWSNPAGTAFDWWPPPPVGTSDVTADPKVMALTGAGKLLAALSGFNTVGVAGTPVGCGDVLVANWRSPCGQLTSRGILVPDAPGSTTEKQPPYGPYYSPSEKQQGKVSVRGGVNPVQQDVFASRFARVVPNGVTLPADLGGAPILYYRANQAPIDTDNPGNGAIDSWDIFSLEDNYLITNPAAALPAAADRWKHPLYAPSDGKTIKGTDYDPVSFAAPATRFFGLTRPFTKDAASAAFYPVPTVPYNATTYVLISPGPDGVYFTADDITNFKQ
jgi:type II secretory pathway pseudopilin PulG